MPGVIIDSSKRGEGKSSGLSRREEVAFLTLALTFMSWLASIGPLGPISPRGRH